MESLTDSLDKIISELFDSNSSENLELTAGEVLISEGEASDRVFILLTGELDVSRAMNGVSSSLARISEPGSLVGEMVALGGGLRTATVSALTDSVLIAQSADDFQEGLAANPELARDLVAMAVRRAEEGELAELLAVHFGIVDEATLIATSSLVRWEHLSQGELLMREGDPSDSMFFVVRGRLSAAIHDPITGTQLDIGEIGRGETVGEIGLLASTPRTATVRATRNTVLARLDRAGFLAMIEKHPKVAIHIALKAHSRGRASDQEKTTTVLSVIFADGIDREWLLGGMEAELSRHGVTTRLSKDVVEQELGSPGIADSNRGEVGDVRVSRLVHERELESDHLIIDASDDVGAWSRRALGMSDRVLIVLGKQPSIQEMARLEAQLGFCPSGVRRTVVFVSEGDEKPPTGSADLKRRFGAENVIHIAGKGEIARMARVATGTAHSLILGGGGGRGFAHIGVYRALVESGFEVDLTGGTSIGGVVAAAIAEGLTPDEIIEWAEEHFPDVLDYTIPIVSLTKGGRIAGAAHATWGDRDIEDLRLTYFALSTDLTTSRVHIHDSGPIDVAIRATSAIPGVMPPVPSGQALLIDGGILNNLPLDIARSKARAGTVVAVDVAPPRGPGAHGDYGLSVSGWAALRARFGSGRSPYPSLSVVLMRSMITASMQERDNQVLNGFADCYLDLDIRGVSMLDFDKPREVALMGYEAAMPRITSWLDGLSKPT